MNRYPARVRKVLEQARELGVWYGGQADAASLCFDVLAHYPDCSDASDLALELFCDEWLIYDNRNAIQQNIDEWDDRPWQQRRRLALSFRFMSRWEALYGDPDRSDPRSCPSDVADILRDGKMQLLHAYCLGDDVGCNYAWSLFEHAVNRTEQRSETLLWVARLYADLGFFADAVEVLYELCALAQDWTLRRLWAEVLWYRDHGHRLPWLPPSGDGSRYRRMMHYIDPSAATGDEAINRMHAESKARGIAPPRCDPSISLELMKCVGAAVPATAVWLTPQDAWVNWSFLDLDDGLPGELPRWAKRMLRRHPGHVTDAMLHRYRWSRPIPRPLTAPRRRSANPESDTAELPGMDNDDD